MRQRITQPGVQVAPLAITGSQKRIATALRWRTFFVVSSLESLTADDVRFRPEIATTDKLIDTLHARPPCLNSLPKRDRLLELLRSFGSCAVAFSGGLDSTVLAKAAQLALGDRAVAVTGVSASLAVGELDEAKELARQIGIRHEVIETGELSIPEYQANQADRCYHCKTELFAQVEQLAERLGVAVVADGSNRDDHGEHRPGMRGRATSGRCAARWPSAD